MKRASEWRLRGQAAACWGMGSARIFERATGGMASGAILVPKKGFQCRRPTHYIATYT